MGSRQITTKLKIMKTGIYKDSGGGEQNVIEVDEAGNRVLVDYGEGKQVWYGPEDYSTWVWSDEWQTDKALEKLGEDPQIQAMLNEDVPREVEDNDLASNEEVVPEEPEAEAKVVKKTTKKKPTPKKSPATKPSTKKKK